MTTKAYPELKGSDRVREYCGKCGGSGSVSWGVQVSGAIHTEKGLRIVPQVCFDCNGVGYRMILVSSVRAREAAAAKKAAEAEAAQQAFIARYNAWAEANQDLVAMTNELAVAGISFAEELVGVVQTEKQEAAIRRIAARRAEEAAEPKTEVPSGRMVVTGVIVSTKHTWSQYGDTLKMLVKDDRGFKVFGTFPTSLADEIYGIWYETHQEENTWGPDCWEEQARGTRVTFTATLERSRDDANFGFYSRPAKAALAN